jgi:outer membrane immunogenic protein
MKSLAILSTIVALSATSVYAGGYNVPVVEVSPVVVESTPVMDWSGAYVGAALGVTDGSDVHKFTPGAFAGYRYDTGSYVVGAEAGYNRVNSTNGGHSADVTAQLGYNMDKVLPYVSVGYSRVSVSGNDYDQPVYGVGVDYAVTDNVIAGMSYDYTRVNDTDLNTVMARVAYKF